MVRDAYSAGGQSQQADGGAAAQPLDLHSSTASLTQELSQLLAASIAQGQGSKRAASPVAAGAELANLQALVSASQRPPQPTFRDGLSSLSYARPVQAPMPPPAPTPAAAAVAPPQSPRSACWCPTCTTKSRCRSRRRGASPCPATTSAGIASSWALPALAWSQAWLLSCPPCYG